MWPFSSCTKSLYFFLIPSLHDGNKLARIRICQFINSKHIPAKTTLDKRHNVLVFIQCVWLYLCLCVCVCVYFFRKGKTKVSTDCSRFLVETIASFPRWYFEINTADGPRCQHQGYFSYSVAKSEVRVWRCGGDFISQRGPYYFSPSATPDQLSQCYYVVIEKNGQMTDRHRKRSG